jgi:hypothetical protein
MFRIHNLAVAGMPTTVLLFIISISSPKGDHLPLVRNRVKVTEEAHGWMPNYLKWCSWSILIIIHVLNTQICGCCNTHHCFAVHHFYVTHRSSFATGEESSQKDQRSTWMSANIFLNIFLNSVSRLPLTIFHVLNSQLGGYCNAQPC